MAIREFTYPLKGNNDVASIRTKEIALEAFLNSLDLSDDPDDPNHNHDGTYAPAAHSHLGTSHEHDQYLLAFEGSSPPLDPDTGDIWIENESGLVVDVLCWTSDGWVSLMGGGGGGSGPHQRHPDEITLYESSSNDDKWEIAFNPALSSLDFNWVG